MYSDGIGNYLELKRNNENKDACIISLFETIFETATKKKENKIYKACILTVFKTILKFR